MSRSNETVHQISWEDRRLIDKGRMLEHVWPRLNRAEQKRIERLTARLQEPYRKLFHGVGSLAFL
jgi:hypothetical protein